MILKEGKCYLLKDVDAKWEYYSMLYESKFESDPGKVYVARIEGELTDRYLEYLKNPEPEGSIFAEEPESCIYRIEYKVVYINKSDIGDSVATITEIERER